MFFVFAAIFFIITLGIALFPTWQSFAANQGFKLFLTAVKTELMNKEPSLPLNLKKNQSHNLTFFIKMLLNRSFYFLIMIIVITFLGSLTLYLKTGSYNYLSQPLAKRLETKHKNRQQYLTLASMLVDRLQKHSENSSDWKWLGQVLFMAEDYSSSAKAFRQAIRYGENSSETYADLGEVLVMEQNGQIMADAIRAFMAALRKDRYNLKANYFLALDKWQKNDEKNAIAIFKQIVKSDDKRTKWSNASKEHIKEITYLTGINANEIEPIDLSVIARGFEP